MRIGLDVGPLLDPPTGVGRYTREIAGGLEVQGETVVRWAVSLRGAPVTGVARWRAPARLVRSSWRRLGGPSIERLVGAVDVVHATNFVLPALRDTPGVVTVHDMSFIRDDVFPGGKSLRDLVPWSVRRAARVIVPTEAIAAEVGARMGVPGSRIDVTPEGVSDTFFGAQPLADGALAHMGIRRPFVLAVGTLEPRKNLARLVEAWGRVRDRLPGWTLVIAGPPGWGPGLPETQGVGLTGWVGDETLPGLFAASELFCYPSMYEGFGLPPLEAMATGTPALVGRYTAAPEVLGDAALLVDPTDVASLAEGLLALATEEPLRRRLAAAGKARAASFTWSRTVTTTIASYKAALG